MTLQEIVAQLPALTVAERRALRDAVDQSLAGAEATAAERADAYAHLNGGAGKRTAWRTRLSRREIEGRLRLARDFGDLDGVLELLDASPPSDEEVKAIIEEERLRKYG